MTRKTDAEMLADAIGRADEMERRYDALRVDFYAKVAEIDRLQAELAGKSSPSPGFVWTVGTDPTYEDPCIAEGICPDHLVPFAEYGQMFDFRPHRYRCAPCGPEVIWRLGGNPQRVSRKLGDSLAWKPVTTPRG